MYYKDYLKDKKIIIVGPSPDLKGQKKGNLIDSYDIVVRLNTGINIDDELKADYGKRTDVCYINRFTTENIKKDYFKDIKYIISVARKIKSYNKLNNNSIIEIKNYSKNKINLNIGIISIIDILKYDVKSIDLTGFNFFNKNSTYVKFHLKGILNFVDYKETFEKDENINYTDKRLEEINLYHDQEKQKEILLKISDNYSNLNIWEDVKKYL